MSAHAGFIVAAYLVTLAVVVGLAVWVIADGRMQRRRLAELEAHGARRRSEGVHS